MRERCFSTPEQKSEMFQEVKQPPALSKRHVGTPGQGGANCKSIAFRFLRHLEIFKFFDFSRFFDPPMFDVGVQESRWRVEVQARVRVAISKGGLPRRREVAA